jgi:hypothetical protein
MSFGAAWVNECLSCGEVSWLLRCGGGGLPYAHNFSSFKTRFLPTRTRRDAFARGPSCISLGAFLGLSHADSMSAFEG